MPMSIFTLNLLEWFHEAQVNTASATGEPLHPQLREGEILLTPDGEKIGLQETLDIFSRTYSQGLYQAARGEEKRFFAVNLNDVRESDLTNPAVIQLREESNPMTSRSFYASLWPYLLLVSLVLLLLEWFINPASVEPRRGMAVSSGVK